MSKYQQLIFKDYQFDPKKKQLDLHYSLDDKLNFKEVYKFDFDYVDYDPAALDRAIQNLFFMSGLSYYRTYVPPKIAVRKGQLDAPAAAFFSKAYQKGFGEFFYINQLDPRTEINFPANTKSIETIPAKALAGQLLGVGGGKDALVSVEILRHQPGVSVWVLNHRPGIDPLIERVGLPVLWGERHWDEKLHDLKDRLRGHIPLSAILACASTVMAILSGHRDVVVSNESSASEPNLVYKGVDINHQYTKSLEFEKDYQKLIKQHFGETVRYYSFLRPFTEVRISEFFAKIAFDKYAGLFTSCNRAFRRGVSEIFWCGVCPKCAFVFLALTPFVERAKLEGIFGKNLLLDEALTPIYRQLLGIEGDKPLECVGEIKEAREAMELAKKIYPELVDKYQYELPRDYDYKKLSEHAMPPEVFKVLTDWLAQQT